MEIFKRIKRFFNIQYYKYVDRKSTLLYPPFSFSSDIKECFSIWDSWEDCKNLVRSYLSNEDYYSIDDPRQTFLRFLTILLCNETGIEKIKEVKIGKFYKGLNGFYIFNKSLFVFDYYYDNRTGNLIKRTSKEIKNTFLHELCHHLDYCLFGVKGHSPNFYKRIEQLKQMLNL